MIGTKLAHYEITSHIGSGGMGDVYQATDTKLGRSVAIKFLPEAFSHDTERVARFQREARVLASLNHPNIAAIHGVEQIDTRHFLVMELVPGETLADRIKRGAIPIEEALSIAKQIAEALEEAHEKGIIHRDLKPANVKVTPDGKVKVLDFGLAKAYESETSNSSLSNSPTLSMAATNPGIILGTAGYMSPEQAQGKEADRRTDMFAFGCVLYEMLTGRQAFAGETVTQILARVLEREPDWSRLPAATSPAIRRLLRRCLQKDRSRRLKSADAVRIEIDESPFETRQPEELASSAGSPGRHLFRSAILIAVSATVLSAVMYFRGARPSDGPEMRVDIVTPATDDPASFAVSPDGRRLVFVASGDSSRLWLRSLDGTTAQPMAGTEGARFPFWSPDSRSVGFFAATKLKRIDIGGGLPHTLTDIGDNPGGGTWSPDGIILFAPLTLSPLYRISASGVEKAAVTKLQETGGISHRFPQFLPGGRQFLFFSTGGGETQGIYMGSLNSPEIKRLTSADTAGAYAPPGWLLYLRQDTLVARRFDIARGELTGDPITIANPVASSSNNYGAFSVSSAGLLSYRAGGSGSQRQLTWFDRSGKAVGMVGPPDDSIQDLRLSRDGRRVAVDRDVANNTDVSIIDGPRMPRFTFDPAIDFSPVWSPDGSRIVFASNRKGHFDLFLKPSNGESAEELLLESAENKNPNDWSSDGRFILYLSTNPQTAYDLWVLPLSGDRKPFAFLKTKADERGGHFSPDGRWVSYQSNESGRFEIYVRPFPGPGGQWQISTAGGVGPRWRSDGKELYFVAPDGSVMAASIATEGETLQSGPPQKLFQPRILKAGTTGRVQYDVASDGRFLIDVPVEQSATTPITLLMNWKPPTK
jgi:serine/threonine protein kinase/Tol biopolymer transport system component